MKNTGKYLLTPGNKEEEVDRKLPGASVSFLCPPQPTSGTCSRLCCSSTVLNRVMGAIAKERKVGVHRGGGKGPGSHLVLHLN